MEIVYVVPRTGLKGHNTVEDAATRVVLGKN